MDFDYPDFETAFIDTPPPQPTNQKPEQPLVTEETEPASALFSTNQIRDKSSAKNSMPSVDRSLKPKVPNQTDSVNSLEKIRNEFMREEKKEPKQENREPVAIRKSPPIEITQNDEKPVENKNKSKNIPVVDRAIKPVLPESKTIENGRNLSSEKERSPSPDDSVVSQLSQLQDLLKGKEEELRRYQRERDGVIAEHRARSARLKDDEAKLEQLRIMRAKEEKDVADLMRQKRRIQDDLSKQQSQEEKDNRDMRAEEKRR